jgi:hypothetical protein
LIGVGAWSATGPTRGIGRLVVVMPEPAPALAGSAARMA